VFTIATILNPWFLSLFEIHTASSKFDTKHFAETATNVGGHHSQPSFVLSVSRPSSGGGGSSMRGVHLNADLNLIFVATERKLVPVAVRLSLKSRASYLWRMSNNFFT
jgi:hypothetical protein